MDGRDWCWLCGLLPADRGASNDIDRPTDAARTCDPSTTNRAIRPTDLPANLTHYPKQPLEARYRSTRLDLDRAASYGGQHW